MNTLEILSNFLCLESLTSMHWIALYCHFRTFTILSVPNSNDINSSDAGDGMFRVWRSMQCLLIHRLLKSPVHQQACYWLCGVDNMYFAPKLISSIWVKPYPRYGKKYEYVFHYLSMLRINVPLILFNIRFSIIPHYLFMIMHPTEYIFVCL